MTNVEKYVECAKEIRVWEIAIADEGETPARKSKLLLARAQAKVAYAKLHGREAWQAQQILKGRTK